MKYLNRPIEINENMEFPEILICNANLFNKTYLGNLNISESLTGYLYKASLPMESLDIDNFGENLQMNQHLEKQYQALLTMYPNYDIREFMVKAGVRCEAFLRHCMFNNSTRFNCCEKATSIISPIWGACFLFKGLGVQKSEAVGGLTVFMELDDNVATKGEHPRTPAGAIVQIHQRYDPTSLQEIIIPLESRVSLRLKVSSGQQDEPR